LFDFPGLQDSRNDGQSQAMWPGAGVGNEAVYTNSLTVPTGSTLASRRTVGVGLRHHCGRGNQYPAAGGTASNPLPAPETGVATDSHDLAIILSDGWENLYLEGAFGNSFEGNDQFFAEAASQSLEARCDRVGTSARREKLTEQLNEPLMAKTCRE
jgi:hypothetical protein